MDSSKRELERLTAEFWQGLAARGTDLRKTDADPLGDGDQSPLYHLSETDQDIYQSAFVLCGNISVYMNAGACSHFGYACIIGHVRKVKEFLLTSSFNFMRQSQDIATLASQQTLTLPWG